MYMYLAKANLNIYQLKLKVNIITSAFVYAKNETVICEYIPVIFEKKIF